ncbi:MAG: hypothetical protein CVV42_02845 [Candidatus Riflebacteria bacterium HGW-Riflebacteria-2]|jgi:Tfp pilus assembly protein PilO|nr:MAG: hypothetical protein CVV42_02845 [Candidatus Riflebacteria bacterium HGW-Riflebacteria-2]
MNNIATNLVALFIVLIVVFFAGRIFLLADVKTQLTQAESKLAEHQTQQTTLEAEYEKLKNRVKNSEVPLRSNKLLIAGQEASLLRSVIDLGGKSMRLNSYSMLPSFMVKPAEEESYTESPSQSTGNIGELPQLDEQGMPVGLAEEDEEWPGVEIIPVKMTFTSTYRSFGKFLSDAGKSMPVNSVRSMDLLMKSDGIVKGTLIMNFPVAENGN